MTKRSGSNNRRRSVCRPVRLTPDEDEEIKRKAAECKQTISRFLRSAALDKRVISLTDDQTLSELKRLGGLQKKLFIEGHRTGSKEYSEVLIGITQCTSALLSRLLEE